MFTFLLKHVIYVFLNIYRTPRSSDFNSDYFINSFSCKITSIIFLKPSRGVRTSFKHPAELTSINVEAMVGNLLVLPIHQYFLLYPTFTCVKNNKLEE